VSVALGIPHEMRMPIVSGLSGSTKFSHIISLTFKHSASCILGQAFHYSPEKAFFIFNQQIYFFI